MDGVNARQIEPSHLAFLLNRVIRRMRDESTLPSSWPADLTVAKARLLDVVPRGGCRIVDLSGELRVSKQGLGQLVRQLVDGGYLQEAEDPTDRRARIVKRTRRGDHIVKQVLQVTTELEARWRQEIGPRDYDLFRDVLIRLVAGAKHSASPTASGPRARAAE
jgi:DNA-binding MarR family transcriptional regulator